MNKSRIDWTELDRKHPPALIAAIKNLFSEEGPFQISAEELSSAADCRAEEADTLLGELCPPLDRQSVFSCPNCDLALSDDEAHLDLCPNCHSQYAEHGDVRIREVFVYRSPRSRDVTWVLALHGMDTLGAWQEEFNWRVSTAYGRSVPVAIYKYGLVRPGAIWFPFLRRLATSVVDRIQKLKGDTAENGFVGPPDVIAHSLGTWLIGHALRWNPSLVVGRVILTGSILRPDFDWATLISRGQVEAVLNHYGTKDFWARSAHYVIPDSGPSGRYGFNPNIPIIQARADGFKHSDFFTEQNLSTVFETVWRPFLTQPEEQLQVPTTSAQVQWRQAPWLLRATILPLIILISYWGILAVLACCCLLGVYQASSWLGAVQLLP